MTDQPTTAPEVQPLSAEKIERAKVVLAYHDEWPSAGYKSVADMDLVDPHRLLATIDFLRRQLEEAEARALDDDDIDAVAKAVIAEYERHQRCDPDNCGVNFGDTIRDEIARRRKR